jgi:anaerobic magnesium-protoporphyrin IX monomethyl ester cyclase
VEPDRPSAGDLFTRLRSFLLHKQVPHLDHVLSLMKFDYLYNHKHRPRRLWWDDLLDKHELQQAFLAVQGQRERLPANFARHAASEKEYYKHTLATRVSFDLEAWIRRGEWIEGEYWLVVYFPYQEGKTNSFVVVEQDLSVAG